MKYLASSYPFVQSGFLNNFVNPVSGGSKGGGRRGRAPPPWQPKCLHFHAVFSKNLQNRRLAPPWELAPPPRGNPGSATACPLRNSQNSRKIWLVRKLFCKILKINFFFSNYVLPLTVTIQDSSFWQKCQKLRCHDFSALADLYPKQTVSCTLHAL